MNNPSSLPPDNWLTALQQSGYRVTAACRAVVAVVAENHYARDPSQIFIEARRSYPHLGLVTVYRTLEKLETLGLVQRVHQPDGCHAYIAAAAGHQHLFICRACQRAEYFDGDDLGELIERLGADRGFLIQDHWLQLFGLCADCRSAASQIAPEGA